MRAVARLVAVLGAVAIGWAVLSARPREVVLVYDVSGTPGATELAVRIRRGSELVRLAQFSVTPGVRQVRHTLKLPEGAYVLDWRIYAPGASVAGERTLDVRDEGTIVLPLGG